MNIISCVSSNWAIGYNNHLLYNIPNDMEFFKSKTLNKTVIMGSNTYKSLRVKPLPNRNNIVLSKSSNFKDVLVCKNIHEVHKNIMDIPTDDIFIIGGESVYKSFIDDCSVAFITKVFDVPIADTFFPLDLDEASNWKLVETSKTFECNNLRYNFNTYIKDVLF